MAYRFARLAEYLRGWMGYFGIAEYYRLLPEIDHRLAISIGLSRKGPYRLAKMLATQSGMLLLSNFEAQIFP